MDQSKYYTKEEKWREDMIIRINNAIDAHTNVSNESSKISYVDHCKATCVLKFMETTHETHLG